MNNFNQIEKYIHKALIELMQFSTFQSITVTQLAKQAEINRKTFYSYYESKEHLYCTIMKRIFTDLFSCFMYEKLKPHDELNVEQLKNDIRRFLHKTDCYKEYLDFLITEETSYLALMSADAVIEELGQKIHIKETLPGLIPKRFYVEIIRNFFLGMIDCWNEGEIRDIEEGVLIMMRIMNQNQLNTFRYIRGTKVEKAVD